MDVIPEALSDQKRFYDDRFTVGYMKSFDYDIYERCRLYCVQQILRTIGAPKNILDYGCGQGRYLSLLRERFPNARLYGCDISDVGLELAKKSNPNASFIRMEDETLDNREQLFDLVISIEVLPRNRLVYSQRCRSPSGNSTVRLICGA